VLLIIHDCVSLLLAFIFINVNDTLVINLDDDVDEDDDKFGFDIFILLPNCFNSSTLRLFDDAPNAKIIDSMKQDFPLPSDI
jgi:hypothetical protein